MTEVSFDYEPDRSNEAKKIRTFTLANGNQIRVRQEGMYGMWVVNMLRGVTPETLKGEFVTFSDAERAVKKYADLKGTSISDLDM